MSSSDEAMEQHFGLGSGRRRKQRQGGDDARMLARPMEFVSGGSVQDAKHTNVHEDNEPSITAPADDNQSFKRSVGLERAPAQPKRIVKHAPQQKAEFEKHTTGFGSKYLAKFGFTGRLGKNETGIARPIEAQMLKKGAGLGTTGAKPKVDEREKTKKAKKKVEPSWKRSSVAKQKTIYRSAEEVVTKTTETDTLIWDMTRQNTRLTSATQLHKQAEEEEEEPKSLLPELEHNIGLLVDLSESEIHKLDRRRQILVKELAQAKVRRESNQSKVSSSVDAIRRLEGLFSAVKELQTRSAVAAPQGLTAEGICDAFDTLQHKFASEFRHYRIESLASEIIFPSIQNLMNAWIPLSDPTRGIQLFSRWRGILSSSVFERLCEDVIMHSLREKLVHSNSSQNRVLSVVLQEDPLAHNGKSKIRYQVHYSPTISLISLQESCFALMENWKNVLPKELFDELLDALILPKLLRKSEVSDPLRDVIPTHVWCHPWLPIIGHEKLQDVIDAIARRFSRSLTSWHASDSCAIETITPWVNVFRPRSLRSVLAGGIVPKLNTSLSEMSLCFRHPVVHAPAIEWTLQWRSLIGDSTILDLLEAAVWERWLYGLDQWLRSDVDFSVLPQWYKSWKTHLPASIECETRVRCVLDVALRLMNCSVTGRSTATHLRLGLQRMRSLRLLREQGVQKANVRVRTGAVEELSLLELVQKYAELNDVEFVPNVRRARFNGKQIFTFGSVSVLFADQCIYHLPRGAEQDAWQAIGLDDLTLLTQKSKT